MIKKIKIINNVFIGYLYKLGYLLRLKKIKKLSPINNSNIIVSLTSYGRRVDKVVYYTLISILNQTVQPDKIILWLDKNKWNENNIPKKLLRLINKGIEIRYCEDIKSYTKLIPTLKIYPNSIIITLDDDIIYKKNILEKLINTNKKYPEKIITNLCRFPISIDNEKFLPYKQWISPYHLPKEFKYILPLGVSGVLYPPGSLYKEVSNYELAKKLSPFADDLWFWIMAKLQHTNHIVISQNESIGYAFDDLYQYFHKGSALTHSNSGLNRNDDQLKAIMEYYYLTPGDLKNKN